MVAGLHLSCLVFSASKGATMAKPASVVVSTALAVVLAVGMIPSSAFAAAGNASASAQAEQQAAPAGQPESNLSADADAVPTQGSASSPNSATAQADTPQKNVTPAAVPSVDFPIAKYDPTSSSSATLGRERPPCAGGAQRQGVRGGAHGGAHQRAQPRRRDAWQHPAYACGPRPNRSGASFDYRFSACGTCRLQPFQLP